MTTLTELQLAVAATQQSITSRKECESLFESKKGTYKDMNAQNRSTEKANVLTAQENQIKATRKTLKSLNKLVLESNSEMNNENDLATRGNNELARATLLLEVQFTRNKNKLITKDQEVYDDAKSMKHKNKFHHKDNQTKMKKYGNSENYIKAVAERSDSELDYLLMTAQLHETDIGREIKQSVAGMQTIVEERRTTRNKKKVENYNNNKNNISKADKEKHRENNRKRYRAIKAIKPHFGALTKAQGKEKTRRRLDDMTIKLYQKKSAQAIDAELKWNGKRWSFTELANDAKPAAKPTARPSRTSSDMN